MTRTRERAMVPQADFRSYYGRPILKEPTWHALDIAGYLFTGGLAGGASLLGAAADASGRPALARVARYGATGGLSLSLVGLIHDLGRPERFVNMLRVVKPTSPMNLGSWLLAAYGPLAVAAAAGELAASAGVLPGAARNLARVAGLGAAGLGAGVATYTAVLVADTAAPAWHDAYEDLPILFAGSAAAAAGGLGLVGAPVDQALPASVFAVTGAAAELAASHRIEHAPRLSSEAYRTGRAGVLMKAARIATVAGAIGAATVARRGRTGATLSGAALLAGSALARFGVFAAGRQSTRDPKYVIVPQHQANER